MLRALIRGAGGAVQQLAGLVLIGGVAAITACGSEQSTAVSEPQSELSEYRIDETSGEASMTITTARGKATMRTGSSVPVRLPRGISLYPGSAILSSTVVTHPDGVSTMAIFEVEASSAEIVAHFRSEAVRAGFVVEIDNALIETSMLSARRISDGASLLVSTEPMQEGWTPVQLVIGERKAR
jgi:hypothetical protein